jgi:DNA-binding MltR family transcriptional regulator
MLKRRSPFMIKSPTIEELSKEAEVFIHSPYGETDRAMALIGAAFLDDALKSMITGFFVDDQKVVESLLGNRRPLSTFSSRINLAYCLGLITKEQFTDLNFIREIRNEFGHTRHPLNFTSQPIVNWCSLLKAGAEELLKHDPDCEPRNRFWFAVTALAAWITSYGKYIPRQKYIFEMPLVWYEVFDKYFRDKQEIQKQNSGE